MRLVIRDPALGGILLAAGAHLSVPGRAPDLLHHQAAGLQVPGRQARRVLVGVPDLRHRHQVRPARDVRLRLPDGEFFETPPNLFRQFVVTSKFLYKTLKSPLVDAL